MDAESRKHLFDLSISAFWEGRLDAGRAACEILLSDPALSDEERGLTRRNQVFYARQLAEIAPSTRFTDIAIDVQPGWSCFNPSIAADGDGFVMIARSSNYTLNDGEYQTVDGGPVRTENYLAVLDADANLVSSRPLADLVAAEARTDFPVHGFEDCRLVRWRDEWFASATARDLNPAGICQQVLLHIGEDGFDAIWPLSNPGSGFHEKNWMPVDYEGSLLFVYSVSPLVVLRFDPATGGVGVVHEAEGPEVLTAARGGSQLVPFDDGWLSVVHESVQFDDGSRAYPHRFVWFNESLEPVAFSEQFRITGERIDYCTGLAVRNGEVIASFGVDDATARLAVLPKQEVIELLQPPMDTSDLDLGVFLAGEQTPASGDTAEGGADPGGPAGAEFDDVLAASLEESQVNMSADGADSSGFTPVALRDPGHAANAGSLPDGSDRQLRIVSVTISDNRRDIIGAALASVVDWVDACIVVDTGITDDTLEIAQSIAGGKLQVTAFPWTGSFSDARNHALAAAARSGADWAVTVDTDERLVVDPASLRNVLAESSADLLHLRYRDGSYGKERFFRLPARGRFVGPTHEAFVGADSIGDFLDGYFEEATKSEDEYSRKFDRDIALLSRHVVDHPDDPRWRYYLGDSLQNAGRLREAIEQYQACWELDGWDEESAWAMYRAAECQIALDDLDGAIQSCANGMVRHPGIAELPWLAAWASYRKGEMQRAIAWARMSCAIGSVEGIGESFQRIGFSNPRGQYEGPYDVLRFALRELGEEEAAEAADYLFDEALAMRGSSREQEES